MSTPGERAAGGYEIDKIRRVQLREVWPHEALDFTTWLERNPDALSDVLDLELANVEREQRAGSFSVDLVAESNTGEKVVIENQLERSDHDHLGKLITYLAALEAQVAIWIVSDPRPEHVGAITWLNESPGASFYLLKLEAIRIGDSPAAPLLTLITGPSPETREVGEHKREFAERHSIREAFWESLLERARGHTSLHSAVSAHTDSWLSAGSGRSGIHFDYAIRRNDASVYLVIDTNDESQNDAIFDHLAAERDQIEESFGGGLEWLRLEGYKRCVVGQSFSTGGYADDQERWPEIQDEMIDGMVRLERAFKPKVAALPS